MATTILAALMLLMRYHSVTATYCMSNNNKKVDWFIIYKLPQLKTLEKKNMFYYMDVNSPSWSLSETTLDNRDQAVYYTLNQIYSSENSTSADLVYLMYNDALPEKMRVEPENSERGHTKGVIAFGRKSGFWLIHSTPGFPPPKSKGYSWCPNATRNGQSFLCISMETKANLDNIGKQLLYNYPHIYDSQTSDIMSDYPDMYDAMNGKHVTSAPWHRETTLTSLAGTRFLSFAKYSEFHHDLYADWLAPRFHDSLLVETWQSGKGEKMCSNCTGMYKVINIKTINFQSESIEFKETQDHSKWAITNTSVNTWTCIGDINRMISQMHRSGGTVCFQDKSVWHSFNTIIESLHDCNPYRNCTLPDTVLRYSTDIGVDVVE